MTHKKTVLKIQALNSSLGREDGCRCDQNTLRNS